MANLGGSPLGLIGIRSLPTADGMSTFNGGKSRNINVNSYNNATGDVNGTRSIFSGSPSASIAPYGNIGKIGTTNGGGMDIGGNYRGIKRSTLHNNVIYDTSLLNIIEQLSGTQAELRPSDFAYLRNVGVFPNNRLMIARRFLSPHGTNIYGTGKGTGQPSAILISWKPQGEDFLKISFGEKWEEAKADFKNVLDSLGEDFLGKQLGQRIGGAVGVVPLPGFTETLQRSVLSKLGVLEDTNETPLPAGNPNLIKMAKRRSTVASEQAGSGLNCSVSIQMICEWEQKFISGIDPTIAWQDILGKILTFATSRSNNYGLKKEFEDVVKTWMDNPEKIVTDMANYIGEGLDAAKDEIRKLINGLKDQLSTKVDDNGKAEAAKNAKEKKALEGINVDTLISDLKSGLTRQLKKYKIEIEGIARSLSGAPSTPWHITIGNPLRPIFCAGDMYMAQDLTVDLGPTLAFNDLPTSIKATFTLENARPWGLQEIAEKFNAGSIRVVTIVKDANDLNHGETLRDQIYVAPKSGTQTNPNSLNVGSQSNVASTVATPNNVTRPALTPITPIVPAGVQPLTLPTAGNSFNSNLPNTPTPNTAGFGNAIASAQTNLSNLQSGVTSNLSQAQSLASQIPTSQISGLGTTKFGSDVNGMLPNIDINSDAGSTITLKDGSTLPIPDVSKIPGL